MSESLYIIGSMAVFALIGLLTGFLHGHGDDAGAACGGLAGFILAVGVPAMLDANFLSTRRRRQLCVAGVAFLVLLVIIYLMYGNQIATLLQRSPKW